MNRYGHECHEGVVRQGEEMPCDKTAVAMRIDPTEGNAYPVCSYHSRGDLMVPLADLLDSDRATGRAATACHGSEDVECCASGRCEVCTEGFIWGRDA